MIPFRFIVRPFIAELYRQRKGERPEPVEFTGALYDALSLAGDDWAAQRLARISQTNQFESAEGLRS